MSCYLICRQAQDKLRMLITLLRMEPQVYLCPRGTADHGGCRGRGDYLVPAALDW